MVRTPLPSNFCNTCRRLLCTTAYLLPVSREGSSLRMMRTIWGVTYQELGVYGRLRKIVRCGPVAMFRHCCQIWREQHCPAVVAEKARL